LGTRPTPPSGEKSVIVSLSSDVFWIASVSAWLDTTVNDKLGKVFEGSGDGPLKAGLL
jgi:hypothetical protein